MVPCSLTPPQVETLYDALLSNADGLCRDADMLLEAGSGGRARALAILALEESSKAIAIHEKRSQAALGRSSTLALDDTFWKEWTDHLPKLTRVRAFLLEEEYWFGDPPQIDEQLLGPIEDYLKTLDRWALANNAAKLRGFYVDVDFNGTGTILLPDPVDPDEVRQIVGLVDQIGWQVRLGDHIVWRQYQEALDAMGEASPFALCAVSGVDQLARLGSPGWEAFTRRCVALSGDGALIPEGPLDHD
jgi:AbiV family abortive infection protein